MESTSNAALVSLSGEKPRRKRTLDDKACEVCNDKSTGKHYGVYCCDGCSGFFKRTVRRSIPWLCRNNNECVIDQASRTDCRACRFKKCLMVKMNPEGVQGSVGSRSVSYDRTSRENDSEYQLLDVATVQALDTRNFKHPGVRSLPMTNSSYPGSSSSPPISMALPDNQSPDYQRKSDSPVLIKVETEQRNTYIEKNSEVVGNNAEFVGSNFNDSGNSSRNLGHSSENVDKNLGIVSEADSGNKDVREPASMTVSISQQIRPVIPTQQPQIVQKQILMGPNTLYTHHPPYQSTRYPLRSPVPACRLADGKNQPNRTPGTTDMPSTSDSSPHSTAVQLLSKAVQFAKNIPNFKCLPFRDQIILLEESWKDLFIIDAAFLSFPLDVSYNAPPGDGSASLVSHLRVLQELFTRIQALKVDESECAYLKTIVLFKPDIKGLKDSQQIERHQDEAQVKLSDYVRTTHSENPARFGRMLLTLSAFERISQEMIEKLFFRGETNKSVECILHDLFKNT